MSYDLLKLYGNEVRIRVIFLGVRILFGLCL